MLADWIKASLGRKDNDEISSEELLEFEYGRHLYWAIYAAFLETENKKLQKSWEEEHGKTLAEYITSEFQKDMLADLNEKLKTSNEYLHNTSRTDYLTQLLNRRAIFEIAEKNVQQFIRKNKKNDKRDKTNQGIISFAILDIDYFKSINDQYGHFFGDIVLKKLSSTFTDSNVFRSSDIFGRIGGEEFLFILMDCTSEQALTPFQRLQNTFVENPFLSPDNQPFILTFSAGISQVKFDDTSLLDVLERADKALYAAKRRGRNLVLCYESINETK